LIVKFSQNHNSTDNKKNLLTSNSSKNNCNIETITLNTDEIINKVKELPEVEQYLKLFTDINNAKPIIEVDNPNDKTGKIWSVHVYEKVKDTGKMGHTATMNWYSIDKCTGVIKCSFSKYDKSGKYVGNSSEAEYPCI
jgi:hypothetical protein